MAKRDCNSEIAEGKVTSPVIRRNKVSYARQYPEYTSVPSLIFKGQWLAAAGFTTGAAVDIRVMDHCLVITTRDPEQEEPELIKSLRKLSPRKQQQVADFMVAVNGKSICLGLYEIAESYCC